MYKPDILDKIMDFSRQRLDLWHFLAGFSEVNIVPCEKWRGELTGGE